MGLGHLGHDGQPQAAAFFLGGAEHTGESAFALGSSHPRPSISKGHAQLVCITVRGDAQCAAFGHGFSGIENYIEKRLRKLSGISIHRCQFRRVGAFERDGMMLQLVASEQCEIIEQLRHLHRGHARLGVASEVDDVIHDTIEVIHLIAQHSGILAAQVAFRKF